MVVQEHVTPSARAGHPASLLAVAAVALLLGLVAPLAFGPTTWEQRATLGVLLAAVLSAPPSRRGLAAFGPRASIGLLAAALIALVATVPAATVSEGEARALAAARAGERLLALNDPDAALPHFEAALTLDPGLSSARAGAAAAHDALAERTVAAGLSADGYARAAADLAAALSLRSDDASTRTLADAVAAVRDADAIWNDYDWPRTLADLRRAYGLRPDLPGLKDKLYAAEVSYGTALAANNDTAEARAQAERALGLRPDGQEAAHLLAAIRH